VEEEEDLGTRFIKLLNSLDLALDGVVGDDSAEVADLMEALDLPHGEEGGRAEVGVAFLPQAEAAAGEVFLLAPPRDGKSLVFGLDPPRDGKSLVFGLDPPRDGKSLAFGLAPPRDGKSLAFGLAPPRDGKSSFLREAWTGEAVEEAAVELSLR